MAEIGSLLRETRMRERIDITTVESATKIRAKYLRALENEEWDQLPGPTFVRTFLRTYGDYLGLDSKMLVEDYKQRFERPAPQDLLPFGGARASGGRRPPRPSRGVPPWVLLGVVVVLLIGVLFLIGSLGGDSGGSDETAATPTPTATATPGGKRRKARKRGGAAKPSAVSARFVPEGTAVYVCMANGAGDLLVDGQTLTDTPTETFRAKRMRVTFGNGSVKMRVDGKSYGVPDSDKPISYELRPGARPRPISADAAPDCS